MKRWFTLLALGALISGLVHAADAPANFQTHCASCHGADRLGGFGPALLPENLERLRKPEALRVIREGRIATQMQGFADRLNAEEIQALANYVYTLITPAPKWDDADIRASRVVHHAPGSLPAKPVFQADPQNLFVVVEAGDHHVSVLDGDKLERIGRSPTRFALHGGPKYSPDGRYVYFGSRDGWVSKYDLWNLTTVAEVRAGINARNVAVSNDGKWVMVGNYLPQNLVLLDAELNLVRSIPTTAAADGKTSPKTSRVSAVYDAAPRSSFVVAMKDTPEIWELSYAQGAPVAVVRTVLDDILDDFYFDDSYTHLFGATRPDGNGVGKGQVVNLDTRKKIADLDVPGMPHLGSGIAFNWQGKRVMATPNLKEGLITLIDTKDWKTVGSVKTLGPGFFLRSHEKSRYAFTDAMMSPTAKDTLVAIDKQTLEIAGQIRPVAGKTFAHVEFTRDGRYALASLMELDGALIVLDAQTLQEVKRLPMSKPIGKYNVWNKINRSEGTSH
ncbi:cytochrome D1 domain-containing protein [Curvibacter sp. APW13]|uniref:cytochrome D1 domain-containing protein n=1 Tax=Curvibacter sp. APW13 TaxID=3077236 RepID=UPI0028E07EBD|nr:cytochrome D1 domain-containing protein [Curvibacter sp. APW13]MDT8991534.1 cytochrome D1 domain-containing protein [Curvibacter sp. APW13]